MKPDPWVCIICGKHWPIPMLARECELKHLEEPSSDTSETSAPAEGAQL